MTGSAIHQGRDRWLVFLRACQSVALDCDFALFVSNVYRRAIDLTINVQPTNHCKCAKLAAELKAIDEL